MTSTPNMILFSAVVLVAHVILTSGVAIAHGEPRLPAWLVRYIGEERRSGRYAWADLPVAALFMVPGQLVMINAILHPDRVAGPDGAAIAATELVLATCWTAWLWRRAR